MQTLGRIPFLVLCLFLLGTLNSCSQDQKAKKKKSGEDNAAEQTDDDDDTTPVSQPGDTTGGETGDDDDDNSGDDDDDNKSDDALKALLSDCGADDIDNSDEDKVIYKKKIESLPVVKTVLGVKVTIQSTLDIKVSGKETIQDATVEVKEITGLLAPLAKAEAEKQAKENTGAATFANVPFSDYSGLSEHDTWKDIVCTFVPATKVTNERGGSKTVATFDPPLPASVSPKAVEKRYKEEIGKKKTFDDIKATIKESDNPALKGKKSVTGTITVEKVDSEAEVDDGEGGKKKIKADLAYEMTFDFGSPAITYALGLAPKVTYFISFKKKDLVANIVDTSDAGGAVATFIHDDD